MNSLDNLHIDSEIYAFSNPVKCFCPKCMLWDFSGKYPRAFILYMFCWPPEVWSFVSENALISWTGKAWMMTVDTVHGLRDPMQIFCSLMNINELILINVEFCYKSYLQVKSISLRYLRHFQSIDMVPTFPNTKKVTLGEPKYIQYWSPVNVKLSTS